MSQPLIVIAELTARLEHRADLLEALRDDRAATLANEPQVEFRVLVDDADDCRMTLHERYPNRAAFEAHKAQPYFAAFEQAVARCCSKPVSISLLAEMVSDPA